MSHLVFPAAGLSRAGWSCVAMDVPSVTRRHCMAEAVYAVDVAGRLLSGGAGAPH